MLYKPKKMLLQSTKQQTVTTENGTFVTTYLDINDFDKIVNYYLKLSIVVATHFGIASVLRMLKVRKI